MADVFQEQATVALEVIVAAIFDSGGFDDDWDADALAHILWTHGATFSHRPCRYQGPQPQDADYENQCEKCRRVLEKIGADILATLGAPPDVVTAEEVEVALTAWHATNPMGHDWALVAEDIKERARPRMRAALNAARAFTAEGEGK